MGSFDVEFLDVESYSTLGIFDPPSFDVSIIDVSVVLRSVFRCSVVQSSVIRHFFVRRSAVQQVNHVDGLVHWTFCQDTESVQLLAEEVDAIDSPMAGGAPPRLPQPELKKHRPMRLLLPSPGGEPGHPATLAANWLVLDLTYGIPLFDAELNREVMERIVGRGLAKVASLERLSAASAETTAALLDFIRSDISRYKKFVK